MGVVDHCGVLKEGEVYINLPIRGGPQVGPVAAMRNPAFDPDGTSPPVIFYPSLCSLQVSEFSRR
jgi:hypothetical protein